ncbi:MAG: diacylglycerol kinase family lipid kinase [Thermoleophilia bacterium]|nr:diacylglycerol kinase family lipid kinase [Thermoleophilia bacterium]
MRTVVVYNPSSGSGRSEAIAAAVERSLDRRGFEVELHPTQGPGDATAIARRFSASADIIVAVGGDGTINEVVNGIDAGVGEAGGASIDAGVGEAGGASIDAGASHRATLGIVPAGTVNVLALELGLPFQVERACDVIARGKTRPLDLGMANGRRFTLMMGAGVDALTVRNIDLRAKRRFKELAFLGTGLKSGLSTPPPPFLVRAAGHEYEATFFVAGNSRYYAAHIAITPTADSTDGLLDLLIFTGTTRASLAVFWLEVPGGLHVHNAHVTCVRTERAELLPIGDDATVWFQTDGELAGRLPATVEIDAHALEVLVP